MRTRSLAIGTALVVSMSLLYGSPTAARADLQLAPMMWHPQTGSGPVGETARASLVRRADGVSFSVHAEQLRPGHAYTLWFVAINNPSACDSTPCSGPDIVLNAEETDSQVTFGAGHISGASGRAGFAGAIRAGPIEGWLPGGGLWNPMTAQIQLVINDHGPVLRADAPEGIHYMPEMIHTYRAGCTDASLPAIFPASAKADGTPGPNACQLYQVAVFLP